MAFHILKFHLFCHTFQVNCIYLSTLFQSRRFEANMWIQPCRRGLYLSPLPQYRQANADAGNKLNRISLPELILRKAPKVRRAVCISRPKVAARLPFPIPYFSPLKFFAIKNAPQSRDAPPFKQVSLIVAKQNLWVSSANRICKNYLYTHTKEKCRQAIYSMSVKSIKN